MPCTCGGNYQPACQYFYPMRSIWIIGGMEISKNVMSFDCAIWKHDITVVMEGSLKVASPTQSASQPHIQHATHTHTQRTQRVTASVAGFSSFYRFLTESPQPTENPQSIWSLTAIIPFPFPPLQPMQWNHTADPCTEQCVAQSFWIQC